MGKRVLLVQQHDHFRRLIGNLLSPHHEVIGVKDSLDAFVWLGKGKIPDVIIASDAIGTSETVQLLKQLASSGLYSNIPVVYIASPEHNEAPELSITDSTVRLLQPFSPESLYEAIQRVTNPVE